MQGWPLTVDRSGKAANADVRMVAEICRYKHSVGVLAAMFGNICNAVSASSVG